MGALLPQLPWQVLPGPRPQPGTGIPPVRSPQNAKEEARKDEDISVQGRHCEFVIVFFNRVVCDDRFWKGLFASVFLFSV